jgi:hypothetical protein
MAKRTTFTTIVAIVLLAGAVAFLLLLAGVGSGLLTNPPAAP